MTSDQPVDDFQSHARGDPDDLPPINIDAAIDNLKPPFVCVDVSRQSYIMYELRVLVDRSSRRSRYPPSPRTG